MIDRDPAVAAGVLTSDEADAIASAIYERDGVTYVDLGLLSDEELDAFDHLVVWATMGRAQ